MISELMTEDVLRFCVGKAHSGGYESLSEYFADELTELFFKEQL